MRHSLQGSALVVAALLLTGASSAGGTPCPAQKRASRVDVERYIVASEEAWAKCVATKDASVVRHILADDFIWVLDGNVLKQTAR